MTAFTPAEIEAILRHALHAEAEELVGKEKAAAARTATADDPTSSAEDAQEGIES